jgi:hypothetical protein
MSGWDQPGSADVGLHVHDDVLVHVDLQHGYHRHDAPHSGRRGRGHQHQGGAGQLTKKNEERQ